MYGTIVFFNGERGMVTSAGGQRSATFTLAGISGDPAQLRPGETIIYDETRPDGHAIVAVNIRRA